MEVAVSLGMTVHQYIASLSCHREHLLHVAWLREEWNRPNRSDHYLMQIAREVAVVLLKREDKSMVKPSNFLLKFKTRPQRQPSPGERLSASQRFWKALTGLGAKK